MKKKYWLNQIIFIVYVSIITTNCKKEEPVTIPVLSTTYVTDITSTTAISGGQVTSDGGASITDRGICWGTIENPTKTDFKTVDGVGTGKFISLMSGLSGGTIYHVRAYATNTVGTVYGTDLTFTSLGQLPSCLTQPQTNISSSGSTLNGLVNANDLTSTVTFEYGTTLVYGQAITAVQSPLNGNNIISVNITISELSPGTSYHYRVKAENSLGITYGNDITFLTPSITVNDIDGNTYNIVTLGMQVWMKENLKTTRYSNGDVIGTTTPATLDISSEPFPEYQWAYDGDESNVSVYGRLYTGSAVIDTRNICPLGWHVPSDEEWHMLSLTLDPNSLGPVLEIESRIAGGKLKEAGMLHWIAPNTDATNESGFTALPSGSRGWNGVFSEIGASSYWWSKTENSITSLWNRKVGAYNRELFGGYHSKSFGWSVRCIKDN
jgi:uncharacterized protein (TIGR02145 family)